MREWLDKLPQFKSQFDDILSKGIEREKETALPFSQNSNLPLDEPLISKIWSWAGPLAHELINRKNEFSQNWNSTACKLILMKLLCVSIESR